MKAMKTMKAVKARKAMRAMKARKAMRARKAPVYDYSSLSDETWEFITHWLLRDIIPLDWEPNWQRKECGGKECGGSQIGQHNRRCTYCKWCKHDGIDPQCEDCEPNSDTDEVHAFGPRMPMQDRRMSFWRPSRTHSIRSDTDEAHADMGKADDVAPERGAASGAGPARPEESPKKKKRVFI